MNEHNLRKKAALGCWGVKRFGDNHCVYESNILLN